jgi:ribonuclease D
VVRRLAWQPPEPGGPAEVAAELAAHGARPWQVELTALPISRALARLAEKATDETEQPAGEPQPTDT